MPGEELWNKRFFDPACFGRQYAQRCLGGACENVLLIPRLCEGHLWACVDCGGIHEFHVEYVSGPGGRLRYGVVRLLRGEHVRGAGEPTVREMLGAPLGVDS
jgi:hypothetical protein